MSENNCKMITVASDSGKLTCAFAAKTAEEMMQLFSIDIAAEVKKLLNSSEQIGYLPGMYTFSFENKHLSVHHSDLKSEIKNVVTQIIKMYAYEKNVASTRMNFKSDVMNYLNLLHDKHALYAYSVICDETNNTPEVIANNEFAARIGVQFDKTMSEDSIFIFDIKIVFQTECQNSLAKDNQ